jgi:hypothetical protein
MIAVHKDFERLVSRNSADRFQPMAGAPADEAVTIKLPPSPDSQRLLWSEATANHSIRYMPVIGPQTNTLYRLSIHFEARHGPAAWKPFGRKKSHPKVAL